MLNITTGHTGVRDSLPVSGGSLLGRSGLGANSMVELERIGGS